jgi:hypothetical protein
MLARVWIQVITAVDPGQKSFDIKNGLWMEVAGSSPAGCITFLAFFSVPVKKLQQFGQALREFSLCEHYSLALVSGDGQIIASFA